MQEIASNLFAFILGLGFLIFIHEAGHFFVAKLFRVRVLVFSFGFGKRLFGFRRGDTDYRVSLIPLGGYVRMAGDTPYERVTVSGVGGTPAMVPSGAFDYTEPTGAPDEFLSKPKWQRLLILFAGPFMNLLVAVAFLTGLNMIQTETVKIEPVIGTIQPKSPAAKAGLQPGDRITQINEEPIREFDDLRLSISMHAGTALRVTFLRNGNTMHTILTPQRENTDYGPVGRAGFTPYIAPIVGRVRPGSPAEKAGMRAGDRIVSANGHPVTQLTDLETVLEASKAKPIALVLQRGAARVAVNVAPPADEESDPYRGYVPPTIVHQAGFVDAVQESVHENVRMLKLAMTAIGRMFRSEGSMKELSGPISIARISGDMFRRGWINFISLVAMISLQLGIMNLLPIPVLDGGHIMILLIESIARRDLSIRVKERIQQLGFAVLATLMIVVLYNDVISNVLRVRNG